MNNYNDLVKTIKSYFNNRDDELFISNIPNFIFQAQFRIYSELKDLGEEAQLKTFNTKFILNNPILAKPNDWAKTISISYVNSDNNNNIITIFPRLYEFINFYWSNPNLTGMPEFYSNDPSNPYNNFFIAPTPAKEYLVTINYYALPQSQLLNQDNQQNWIILRFPTLLLYASILEAQPFVDNDQKFTMWQDMYDRLLASAKTQTSERYTDRSSVSTI